MKADESTPTPTPAPQTPTPVVQTYTSQWATTPIQQGQHPTASYYQPYTSHYPQAAYATHYQAYAPPQTPTATTSTAQQQQAAAAVRAATTTPAPTAAYQTSTYSLSTAAANTTTAANAASNSSNNNNGGMDTADVATLNDALGSAGVDLRAEEESLQRSSDLSHPLTSSLHHSHSYHRPYEDRTRKAPQPPHCFPTHVLGPTMRTVATNHKVTRVTDDAVNYLALALRARIHDLIKGMVAAARHRTDAQFDRPAHFYGDEEAIDPAASTTAASASASTTAVIKIEVDGELVPAPASDKSKDRTPMWSIVIRKDISKQLAALEKIEREEELRARKERKERAELTAAHAAALAAQASGMASGSTAYGSGAAGGAAGSSGAGAGAGAGATGGDGDDGEGGANPKKKRKKDGPGVTARNMSEDVRKKMSNAVASQAAGLGGRYSWMTAANAGAAATPVKPKPAAATTTPGATATPAATGTTGGDAAAAGAGAGVTGTAAAAAAGTPASSWARPYIPTKKPGFSSSLASSGSASGTTNGAGGKEGDGDAESKKIAVTMRDALFVVEKERGHGAGRGAARGWV